MACLRWYPRQSDELVEDAPLLAGRPVTVSLGHGGHQFLACFRADIRHLASFGNRNCEATMVLR